MALVLAVRRTCAWRRHLSIIGACAFVSVFYGVGSASSASLEPPVITEPFALLPCTHTTTIGFEGCAEGQLLSADRLLNRQAQLIFSTLGVVAQRRGFVSVERQWLAYRTTDCANEAMTFAGGSIAPIEYALCEVRDDRARSADLHSYFQLLEEGASNAPQWP